MKLITATAIAVLIAGPAFAGQPDAPGSKGHSRVIETDGFSRSVEASGQDLTDRAADVFGNNGIGNGGDPDTVPGVGLNDHDPNNFGGNPDTDR
jgi:hypothetical protein